jgi:lysophospholipase
LKGPSGNQTAHFTEAFENTYFKHLAGFPVSVTDIFGQFYRQYLPIPWGYKNVADFAGDNTSFSKGLTPMPIILLSEVVPDSSPEIGGILYPGVNSTNLTIYEQTPFEFGSWIGGRVQAFMPTKFLGTAMNKGTPIHSNHCVNGFDKITFAQGSTGNAWNFWFIDAFYDIALFYKRDRISHMAGRDALPTSSIPIPPTQSDNPQVILVNETASFFNQTFNQSMWATYPNPFNNYNKQMQGETDLLVVRTSFCCSTWPHHIR